MFALGGLMAERAWRDSHGECLSVIDDELYDPDAMSPTDWAGCGCEPGEPTREVWRAADATAALFSPSSGSLWRPLTEAARTLLRFKVIR
jgi:hypothetical protein